jgi:LPS export ABC transporter protein LptC
MLSGACTFDYGEETSANENLPDIVMGNVEYVRVRDGDPVVRFKAQLAERYESRQTMELQNFSFEQFYAHGEAVNATGQAGSALVQLDSGNLQLEKNILLAVDSEDITIETDNLSWQDEQRILAGSETDTVDIQRSDGTLFSGTGFTADARSRTWTFSGSVEGIFVDEDEEDETAESAEGIEGELPAASPAKPPAKPPAAAPAKPPVAAPARPPAAAPAKPPTVAPTEPPAASPAKPPAASPAATPAQPPEAVAELEGERPAELTKDGINVAEDK